ncbi:MAG TPA: hypothetical protein VER76_14255 [Pyrinomonadaceae bacterium]|nr:hypothetical protein [Pyrinomonadaceae bacterium]
MRLRQSPVFCAMFAALVFSVSAGGVFKQAMAQRAGAAATAAKDDVIFAVTRRRDAAFEFEPITIYRRGAFTGSVTGESSAAELTRFANSYYKAGQRYRLIWGGAEAGTLVAKASQKASDCAKAAATADVETSVQLGGNRMALATNSATLGLSKSTRRPPTDAERAGVREHVERIFREKGVPPDALATLQTINLTATDLNADGAAELIGTYMIKRGTSAIFIDQLFIIAEPSGNAFKVAVANYNQLKGEDFNDPESLESVGQSAFLTEILIDQLDVDKDGAGEVFTVSYSFEGTNYSIYKKGRAGWTKVKEFYNYRCAY